MKLYDPIVKRDEALAELRKGNIVHTYNTAEPHDTESPCWCMPEVQRYDTGGVLIAHRQVTWQ